MYTNIKLRFLLAPFFIVGVIPFYELLKLGTGVSQLDILFVLLAKYAIGSFLAILSVFLYLKISHNNSDPNWLTIVGTICMYLFSTHLSFKLGTLFILGFVFLGVLFGTKFYELEFRESFFIGIIFFISNFVSSAVTLILITTK